MNSTARGREANRIKTSLISDALRVRIADAIRNMLYVMKPEATQRTVEHCACHASGRIADHMLRTGFDHPSLFLQHGCAVQLSVAG